MKRTILLAVFACAWTFASTSAREQPPADCKPNPLNIPGAPYPCVYPDNRVMFRVGARDREGAGAAGAWRLTQAGIKNVYYESPGTAHEWLTWRRCFEESAPLLFR